MTTQDLLEEYIEIEKKYAEIFAHFVEVDEIRLMILKEREKKALPLTKLCSNLVKEKFVKSKNGDFYRITEHGIWKLSVEE